MDFVLFGRLEDIRGFVHNQGRAVKVDDQGQGGPHGWDEQKEGESRGSRVMEDVGKVTRATWVSAS